MRHAGLLRAPSKKVDVDPGDRPGRLPDHWAGASPGGLRVRDDFPASRIAACGMDRSRGKLNRSRPSTAISIDGRKAAYTLVAAAESATGRAIAVDEQDIENIIRTKASIYAACSLLLTQVGMAFSDLRKVYIAGGFGRFLDLDSAIAIGLLPNLPATGFTYRQRLVEGKHNGPDLPESSKTAA